MFWHQHRPRGAVELLIAYPNWPMTISLHIYLPWFEQGFWQDFDPHSMLGIYLCHWRRKVLNIEGAKPWYWPVYLGGHEWGHSAFQTYWGSRTPLAPPVLTPMCALHRRKSVSLLFPSPFVAMGRNDKCIRIWMIVKVWYIQRVSTRHLFQFDLVWNWKMGRYQYYVLFVYGPGWGKTCLMSSANNKGADQPAHPRSLISAFVVRSLDSIISLVSRYKISRFWLVSVAEQAGLTPYRSTPSKTHFRLRGPIFCKFSSR